jgi:NADH:ubiquinone oxidoreductase subunit 4 (subunit M)
MMAREIAVPLAVWAIAAIVMIGPVIARRGRAPEFVTTLTLCVLLAASALTGSGPLAYGLFALVTIWQAWQARVAGVAAVATFGLSALATAGAALALQSNAAVPTFLLSVLAVALRAGLMPIHVGVAALCDRAPFRQVEQLGATVILVFIHARFADDIPLAHEWAPFIVAYGALFTLVPGLMSLVQPNLRGFYRTATAMHGGMLVAGLGASGLGHSAAAIMVIITTAVALGGLGLMVDALEARAGTVRLAGPGGRVQAFPRLAVGFALFGAAGVAMPGTAGFIADDLLLHALWGESVAATVMIIAGSAALAIGTLRAYAAAFLGPARPSPAPDLHRRERVMTVTLLVLLITLGLVPGLLLTPADALLGAELGR